MMTLSIQEDMQIKYEAGLERGLECGLERGLEQGKKEIALEMLSSGMDRMLVCKFTGLSESDLKGLEK